MKAHVNLLGPEQLGEERFGIHKAMLPIAFLLVIVGILVATVFEVARSKHLKSEIEGLNEKRAQLVLSLAGIQSETNAVSEQGNSITQIVRERAELLNTLNREHVYWSGLLQEISLMVPEGVWLTRMESSGSDGEDSQSDKISGEAKFVGFGLAYSGITQFMAGLGRSPNFGKVTLIRAQKASDTGNKRILFEIRADLK
jgi:Tfp pilus assembly protein PilN